MALRTLLSGRQPESDPPGYDELVGRPSPTDSIISYQASKYNCRLAVSPDGTKRIAYGRRHDGSESKLFRFDSDHHSATVTADRPTCAVISNDGTAAVLEAGAHDELGGRVRMLSPDGTDRHSWTFETNVSGISVSPDGQTVGILTRPPEQALYCFDASDGTELSKRSIEFDRAVLAGIVQREHGILVYLTDREDGPPYLAVDSDGSPAWRSERFRDTEPLVDRVRGWISSPAKK